MSNRDAGQSQESLRDVFECLFVSVLFTSLSIDTISSLFSHESQPLIAKKAFTVSSRGNKEWAADGFKKFSEWSKTEFCEFDIISYIYLYT